MTNEYSVGTSEAAAMLGITKEGFSGLCKRRGWKRIERNHRHYYAKSDIEAEIASRAEPANFRVPPAVAAHTKKCADRIRTYWQEKGHSVNVEAQGGEIVSNLVNGLPR